MNLLGIDLGSSSIKLAVIDSDNGKLIAQAQYPDTEMHINAPKPGWAEQTPEDWWDNIKEGLKILSKKTAIKSIGAIGITYQMHGLVCIDKNGNVLRPSIIWCDSRAVEIGQKAFLEIGEEKCLSHLLNSPGNFTASKLAWVKENEPETFAKIDKIMLPGDYIAMKLSGNITTTVSGLSEGMFWNFSENGPANFLLDYYGIPQEMVPQIVPTFAPQGEVSESASAETGLAKGTPICYRAGDQPNNAFSLNVLEPGEIAATAGTSGVVYAVSDQQKYDPKSRVNSFAHVNHTTQNQRYGVLLCINGTGILNNWLNKNAGTEKLTYEAMNQFAADIPIGSDGVAILPFGNGAERVLENKNINSQIANINFNIHNSSHLFRAAQEGIAFSFMYGINLMQEHNGLNLKTIRAGNANMFLSPIFRETLATVTGQAIEIYDTDGSLGAARGAGIGANVYANAKEAFSTLTKLHTIEPGTLNKEAIEEAYLNWSNVLTKYI